MDDDDPPDLHDSLGHVLASSYRTHVLWAIAEHGPIQPSTIADHTDLEITHVSRTLRDLVENDLAVLHTPDLRKGRLYGTTDHGDDVADEIPDGEKPDGA